MRLLRIQFVVGLILSTISCKNSPQAPPNTRPNILFAIADDQSFPHAGAYGCTWVQTPAFDRIAKEGLLFNKAYTPNAKCAPSRSCILTGRNSWQLEEAMNHWPLFPEKFKTFAESLSENGYFVGKTGKGWAPGIAMKNGQVRNLLVQDYSEKTLSPPAKHISNNDYTENFRSFLTDKPKDEPFFFWYGSTEPHRRYEFQAGLNKGGKKLEDVDGIPAFWPDTDTVRTDMLDYAYEIEYFDQHLANMIAVLEEHGMLENTLIVVTSDNGMPFPRIKGQVYEYDNHLPLAMRWGRGIKNPGRAIDQFVNFIDFAPTFLELAGITEEESGMARIRGRSLFPVFDDSPNQGDRRDFVLIGKERHDVGRPNDQGYPVRGIIKDGFTYTMNFHPERWPAGDPITGYLNCDGSPTKTLILNERRRIGTSRYWELNFGKRPKEELYNTVEDPFCLSNLATEPAYKTQLSQMRDLMLKQLALDRDPRMAAKEELIESYQYMDKGTAGFYDRYLSGEELNAGWVNPGDFEAKNWNE